jgi:hypothetical protein
MGTTWKIQGPRPKAKIIAECPVCHTTQAFLDEGDPINAIEGHKRVIKSTFKHNGCGGLVEKIPIDIQREYWDSVVLPEF